jgi:hypothetical protein
MLYSYTVQCSSNALYVKFMVFRKSDHPKLYLWAKSWEKDGDNSSAQQTSVSQQQTVNEDEFKPKLEKTASCCHNEEKATSDTNTVAKPKVTDQKDAMPNAEPSELKQVESPDSSKQDSKTGDRELNLEKQVQKGTAVTEIETSKVDSSSDAIKDEDRLDCKSSEKNYEPEIETVATENVDGVDFSSSEEQHPSSTNRKSNSDSSGPPDEDRGTKTNEPQLQSESTTEKSALPDALGDVHGHNHEAPPAAEHAQVKEQLTNTVAEDQVLQSEKKGSCSNEVCPERKSGVTDVCGFPELDPSPAEETAKPSTERKPDETTSRLEDSGLLHQALTNGNQAANPINNGGIGGQLDATGHPMLQLPICQSELMQFASTMADNLSATGKFAAV